MSIKIPKRLLNKLSNNRIWHSNVNNVIENVEDIFSKGPYFFEEYTEHGIMHINHVLEISDKLIPDDTLETITERTLGMYLISAILHDIGMYINYDNLIYIIEEKNNTKISELDKFSIAELWKKYLVELKRYTESELRSKFGTVDIQFDSLPELSKINTIDKLIIGEFIRQNHHKISHYIINNIVKLSDIDILKDTNIDNQERDLIGLIARSHGVNLRSLEEYLDNNYSDLETPIGIEIFYIMSLLRLSDYLDAGEERASHIIEEMYVKHSKISKEEFAWNQCIKYENYNWKGTRQKVVIQASPENGYNFSKVTKWTESVQRELDLCWAIISEYYNVNKIKFSINRIDCNILKEKVIENHKEKFYPNEVRFEVNPDILKLLIQPLYSDDPSYGVRELVQNSVDACREREAMEDPKDKNYSGNITVNIDTKAKLFTIEDNGVGMTVDTIVNYYLKAGSSYRRSSAWGEDFLDDDGKPKVLRTGKFGIGVLATFLLGNEATITTRNINDNKGWKFTIKLDQDNIEIVRTEEKTTYGTTISVTLSDVAINKFKEESSYTCKWYQWYVDSNPTIEYKIDGQIKKRIIINPEQEGWFELKQSEYEKYYWHYNTLRTNSYCNGILVPISKLSFIRNDDLRFLIPDIYIQDKKGIIPVNLSRNEFTQVPCRDKLIKECFKYYLAKILKLTLNKTNIIFQIPHFLFITYFRPINFTQIVSLVYYNNGFYPELKPFRKYKNITNYKILFCTKRNFNPDNKFDEDSNVIIAYSRILVEPSAIEYFAEILKELNSDNRVKCIFVNKSLFNDNLQKYSIRLSQIKSDDEHNYVILTEPDDTNEYKTDLDVETIMVKCHEEYSDDEEDNTIENKIMMYLIKEYFPPDTLIPYDLEERKRVFPKAFKELEKYMYD